MDIVEEKGIERVEVSEPIVSEVTQIKEKPKRKPRSEAQKEAFEKARLVRAANLAKKKAEAEVEEEEEEEDYVEPPKPAPKKRGRPKGSKLKREPVPEVGQFSPPNIPPQAGDIRYQYQHPTQGQASQYQYPIPYQYYTQQQQPPPQLAPQVHNYYYGHQQGAIHSQSQKPPVVDKPREPEPEPESSEEEEYEEYQPQPQLRYCFG